MQTDSRRLTPILILVVASIGVGMLIGYWLRPDSQALIPANDNSALRQDLLAAIGALRTDIEERFSQVDQQDQRVPADDSARSPVEPADSTGQDDQRFQEMLSRLEQLLASPPQHGISDTGPMADLRREMKGPGYPSLEVMRQQGLNRLRDPDNTVAANLVDQWREAHMLWRGDDVVLRYGRPERLEWGRTYRLVYSGFDTAKETCDIFFKLDDEYVVEVFFDCADIR